MLLLATILFIVLSPGVFLTIPPVGNSLFLSGKTSLLSVAVHALLFTAILYCCKQMRMFRVLEGFTTPAAGQLGGACNSTIVGGSSAGPIYNYFCSGAGLTCDNGVCRQYNVANGQPCDANRICGDRQLCQNGICAYATGAYKGPCKSDGTCNSMNLECSNNICKQKTNLGFSCDDTTVCTNGICYNSKCRNVFELGAVCTTGSNDVCREGACKTISLSSNSTGKRCVIDNIALGGDCLEQARLCTTGLDCQDSKCKNRSSLAGPCDANTYCPSPLVCNRGVCLTPESTPAPA